MNFKYLYRLGLLIIFLCMSAYSAKAVGSLYDQHWPKREQLAVWLTTIGGLDWPHCYAQSRYSIEKQKAELITILDKLHHAGINTVLLQTRIRGTVIYPSAIEPWDGCCSGVPGKSPGYDPLQFAIEQCHKRGMELQAWIVTVPVGRWNALGCKTLRKKHPHLVVQVQGEGYINPASPQAKTYLANICAEITRRYDIDGIHLDYIRYPETWHLAIGADVARHNITAIVEEVNKTVKHVKPWVKTSSSPIGKYADLTRYSSKGWSAYNRGYQDAKQWLQQGYMDELYPMMYFRDNQFYPFAADWRETGAYPIASGIGIYQLLPSEANWSIDEVVRQLNVSRRLGLGQAFFRSKFLTDDVKGIYTYVANHFYRYPALLPVNPYHNATVAPPVDLKVMKGLTIRLFWNEPQQKSSTPLYYNVYASNSWPVDVDNPQCLLAVRQSRCSMTIEGANYQYWAVTAMDSYGNESVALQQPSPKGMSVLGLLPNDGIWLKLRHASETMALLKDLTGRTVSIKSIVKDKGVSISHLAPGYYYAYSLNKKGITHRLGLFMISKKSK